MGSKRRTHRCENLARETCRLSLFVVQRVSDQALYPGAAGGLASDRERVEDKHSESQSGLIAEVERLRAIRSQHGNWNRQLRSGNL